MSSLQKEIDDTIKLRCCKCRVVCKPKIETRVNNCAFLSWPTAKMSLRKK